MPAGTTPGRGRLAASVAPLVLLIGLAGLPAAAATAASDPQAAVDQARSRLDQARSGAAQQDTLLAAAQQDLAAARARLQAVQDEAAALDRDEGRVRAELAAVQAQERADRDALSRYLRAAYERGVDAPFLYIAAADSITEMVQRQAEMARVASANSDVVDRIAAERGRVEQDLHDLDARRDRLAVLRAQAAVAADVVQNEEARVQVAAATAQSQVAQAQSDYAQALAARNAALAAARRPPRPPVNAPAPVAPPPFPVTGPLTVDTDLTQPSGMTAQRIDAFLSGTAMAGLGSAFMAAEQSYHVNARYFVAHAINESAWGTSRIAQDKHNLFGYGADDTNPYGDAYTFASFADGIDFVARAISKYYLTPGGMFYVAPTLRGINVHYASDPTWCYKIARIADEIP